MASFAATSQNIEQIVFSCFTSVEVFVTLILEPLSICRTHLPLNFLLVECDVRMTFPNLAYGIVL